MTLPQRPKLRDDLVSRWVEEDLVLYDPVTDKTVLLNPAAALILDLCDGTRDAAGIAQTLRDELDETPSDLEDSVVNTLQEFRGAGFFEVTSPPS